MNQDSEIDERIDDIRERVLQGDTQFTSKDVNTLLTVMELYKSMIPRAEKNAEIVRKNQEKLVAALPKALEGVHFPQSKKQDYLWLACYLSVVNDSRTEQYKRVHTILLEIVRNDIRLESAP